MADAVVGIVMGSDSDWPLVKKACETLDKFGVPYETRVISAHRTPDVAIEYSKTAESRGLKVIIAAAGGAAHLGGVLAAATVLPVIGIPVAGGALNGLDALYATVLPAPRTRRFSRCRYSERPIPRCARSSAPTRKNSAPKLPRRTTAFINRKQEL